MGPPSSDGGHPLQLVKLDMEARKVEVNEEALTELEGSLRKLGTQKVAIVSVMGAFRTGKSFLLDLFLRFLRYDGPHAEPPPRGSGEECPLPAWLTDAGTVIDGATDESCHGFRFKGGMDACTEGIWIWSEPFLRVVGGQTMAMLLMDTQGAWDSSMTKEQSATVFGLTAVLSSKQIYNINMQIQEDKVENLAYFMRFAQAAIRKAAAELPELDKAEVERPFQSLDFVVRDWRHFREEWSLERCEEQMAEHLSRHVNPKQVAEGGTAEALQCMFHRLGCFCLPHPGLAIEREAWTGEIRDISPDFLRFADAYARRVFDIDLEPKRILGAELSTLTLLPVLRNFVAAFHDTAPAASSFTQAMTSATVLLAKEAALKSYTRKMDAAAKSSPRGMAPEELQQVNQRLQQETEEEFKRSTIFGADTVRVEAWDSVVENLGAVYQRYVEDNGRRLERALARFANWALLALALWVLDRASDWTCDWWSRTCVEVSKLLLAGYLLIALWIGINAYMLMSDRGRMAMLLAGGELWKEMMRLFEVYYEAFFRLPELVWKKKPPDGNSASDKKND